MQFISPTWSERHKALSKTIRDPSCAEENKQMILALHGELHRAAVSGEKSPNNTNALFAGLANEDYAVIPTQKDETIAWAIWHLARIEDLTMNLLVSNCNQVFNAHWKLLLNTQISDTGNAMTDEEIIDFSKNISITDLLCYRDAVGKRSREIVHSLSAEKFKEKITGDRINRIPAEGGVTQHPDSLWLLDFWGKKDVSGIIMMPLTRHQTLHLNDCHIWKEKICKRR
jgi:hypothetical protein